MALGCEVDIVVRSPDEAGRAETIHLQSAVS
jgi:hypothetical protein